MPDGIVLVPVTFPLLWFFLSYQSFGENNFVHTGNHNLVISLGNPHKNVFIEILEPLLHQGISKKQESLAILATSICLSLIFAVAFSFIFCCLLPLYHEDIFEKKNVHECLQCPPHWNTWGKVSSLTLWSIPTPQLEPQSLIPLQRRSFFSWWGAIFLLKGVFIELELY